MHPEIPGRRLVGHVGFVMQQAPARAVEFAGPRVAPNLVPNLKLRPAGVAAMRALLALVLVVFVLLAGCAASGPAPKFTMTGLPSYEVDLVIRDVAIEPGRCFDGATVFEQECHVVRLRLDNSANAVTVETQLSWSAADAAGGGVPHGEMKGPSSVAPHGSTDLTIRFTTPQDSPHLIHIVFHGYPGARGEADLPGY